MFRPLRPLVAAFALILLPSTQRRKRSTIWTNGITRRAAAEPRGRSCSSTIAW
jgi:hypothetical protein